jgi:hypothetical protein
MKLRTDLLLTAALLKRGEEVELTVSDTRLESTLQIMKGAGVDVPDPTTPRQVDSGQQARAVSRLAGHSSRRVQQFAAPAQTH